MRRFLLPPPAEVGDKYGSSVVPVEAIARIASSVRVLRRSLEIGKHLADDPYTRYVAAFCEQGLALCGESWGFMDIVSVLYAAAELGQPENYLEIGVRRGRSICAVVSASPRTHVYAFDMWQPGYANNENPGPDLVRRETRKVGFEGPLEFIDGDSHRTVPAFLARNPSLTFDLITVDGDHSLDGAWDDLRNVTPRLRVGGVLVFDDTANPYTPGLDAVWARLLQVDAGLQGFSYGALGAGVSFAIRRRPLGRDIPKKRKPWPRAF